MGEPARVSETGWAMLAQNKEAGRMETCMQGIVMEVDAAHHIFRLIAYLPEAGLCAPRASNAGLGC